MTDDLVRRLREQPSGAMKDGDAGAVVRHDLYARYLAERKEAADCIEALYDQVANMDSIYRRRAEAAEQALAEANTRVKELEAELAEEQEECEHYVHTTEATVARAERLAGALDRAAQKFREYEGLHAAKETLDGDVKARANAEMAGMCEAALAEEPKG